MENNVPKSRKQAKTPYERLRNRVLRKFAEVKYIGDIQISDEEYEILLEYLNTWDNEYQLSASLGIVHYTAEDTSALETILKHADKALYQAKLAGKNTYKFFEA